MKVSEVFFTVQKLVFLRSIKILQKQFGIFANEKHILYAILSVILIVSKPIGREILYSRKVSATKFLRVKRFIGPELVHIFYSHIY